MFGKRVDRENARLRRRVADLEQEVLEMRGRMAQMESNTNISWDCVPREWGLNGQETRIAAILVKAEGGIVRTGFLRAALWRKTEEPKLPRKNLEVHILRLRRKLEPHGVVIQNIRSLGYFLERKPPRFDLAAQVKALGADRLLP